MEKPAICGGEPVRSTKIFYGHQFIDEDDIQAVVDVLKSDYLTCGPKIGELEEKLCEVTGAKYAVVCSNGTAALHIACLAAGVMPGDEELDRLLAHCREHNLVLIEDGAHVIGTSYKGRMNGSIADMTTMSFHPVKTVTGGEGGAVLTNSKEYYEKLLLYRAHGITRDPKLMEHEPDGPWYYEQIALGMNYRMTDMQAALIISQLNKLPRFMERRKAIVKAYNEAFSRLPQLFVQQEIPESDTTRHLYILRIRPEKLTIDRKQFFEALAAENICCNVHYIPTYYFPYYERLGFKRGLCPKAEKLYAEEISLPLYYAMTDQDVEDVIRAVTRIAEYFKA